MGKLIMDGGFPVLVRPGLVELQAQRAMGPHGSQQDSREPETSGPKKGETV
jgi:hypothetical protein